MSYVVAHVQKLKSSDLRGLQIHNQRESERTYQNNPDMDRSRTHENYDLAAAGDVNYNRAVKARIAEGRTSDTAVRKDAVVAVSFLVSSDREFFNALSPERQREFFQSAVDYVAEKIGRENIISAKVHLDETTPHIHITTVPITADGRLSAKDLINRKTLRDLQEELPRKLQAEGFKIERGEPKTESLRKHMDVNEFKRVTLKQQSEELSKQEQILLKKQSVLEQSAAAANDRYDQFVAIDKLQRAANKTVADSGVCGLFKADSVKIGIENLNALCNFAKASLGQGEKLQVVEHKAAEQAKTIKAMRPAAQLGQKVEKMLTENPEFKRQFAAAEMKHQESLAEKLARQIKSPTRRPGLKADLDPDDDKPKRGIKL